MVHFFTWTLSHPLQCQHSSHIIMYVFFENWANSKFRVFFHIQYVLCSTLLHLPPLRFHCVAGSWDGTRDCCNFGIGSQRSNHLARSHPQPARSHTRSAISSTTRLDLIHALLDLIHTRLDLIHNSARSPPQLGWISSTTRLDFIHIEFFLTCRLR
jgi:hypothetical protein